MPEKWENFYQRFINRIMDDEYGEIFMDGLFIFAASKDYLSKDHLRLIIRNSSRENLMIFDRLSEFLIESLTDRGHFQLFHETFYEYLNEHHSFDLLDAEDKIIDFCMQWERLERYGLTIVQYPLRYLAIHLKEAQRFDDLKKLAHNELFITRQIKQTDNYEASFNLLVCYRDVAIERRDIDNVVDALIQLLELHERFDKTRDMEMKLDDQPPQQSLQQIRFYKLEEQAKWMFIILWKASECGKHKALIKTINAFEEYVSEEHQLFQWTDHIPLALLVKLAVDLQKFDLNISFIKPLRISS